MTPSDRLRALHGACEAACLEHAIVGDRLHCWQCEEPWPCDTIKVLDAADALAEAVEEYIEGRCSDTRQVGATGLCTTCPSHLKRLARAYRGAE